jgi:signal transduction histidine kinase
MALVMVIAVTTVWISRAHDKLAEVDSERMVAGGLSALEDKLRTITIDYSLWTEAYDGIRTRDMDWIWSNIGSAAAETGTTDLMIIIEPGEAVQYGWVAGMGETPSAELLPADTIEAMLRLLDDIPVDARPAASRFVRIGGVTWLLAIARVTPYDGPPAGVIDQDLPRHLFGLKIDNRLISELGAKFLVDDLTIAQEPVPGMSNVRLGDGAGFGGYAVWTAHRPGSVILGKIALPLILVLGAIVLGSALVSRHVVLSAKHLGQAVGEARAAQAADRTKTDFLANVSHELRTPMNGIIGMGQLIQTMDLEPKLAGMVDVMVTSARSQMTLIEELLDIARIDSGQMQLDHSPFDPVAVLNEVRDLVMLRADEKGLAFSVETPAGFDAKILGDSGCYKQVLTNLVGNAIKFTDQGSVTVRMDCKVLEGQMHIAITVVDTGPGIDPRNHELIFERFGQVDGMLTRGVRGTGLGLAITKSLVELMGGKLGLQSELGKGAVFFVDLVLEVVAAPGASLAAE